MNITTTYNLNSNGSKGTVIPKRVQQLLRLNTGSKLGWEIDCSGNPEEDGECIVRIKNLDTAKKIQKFKENPPQDIENAISDFMQTQVKINFLHKKLGENTNKRLDNQDEQIADMIKVITNLNKAIEKISGTQKK